MLTSTSKNPFQNIRSIVIVAEKIRFSIDNLWEPKKKKILCWQMKGYEPLDGRAIQHSTVQF
jgi:hypothetical protein